MKLKLALLAFLAATFGFAAENVTTNTPPAGTLAEANADEIDLEELDDSADAAKLPQVRKTADEGPATLVDITCDNATLADILRQFRKVTDANIISDDSTNLQRRVSVNLHRVPWLSGLQSILNSRGYRLEERGDIFFVKEDKVAEPIVTRSFELKHASAKELTELFNKSYGKKDTKGTVVLPIATCFEGANVVVVTATEKVIADCESIIKAVDKAVAQIYIEARFLELSSEALHRLGMQWNQLESWGVSTKNVSADFNISYKRTRNGGDTKALSEVTGNQAGFSGALSADDFRLALSAFESMGEGKIFSNPKIIVSNGKDAKVDMTTKFPNLEIQSKLNTDTASPFYETTAKLKQIEGDKGTKELGYKDRGLFAGSCFFEWGITLTVKPRISPDGLISVEITPAISQLNQDLSEGGTESGYYETQSGNSFGKYPIIQMKQLSTDFTMKDGSTAVIGGLTKTMEDDVDTGIPYLRKIPWIGQKLFGWKSRQKVQKEIIVCVTLGIANPADLPKDIGLPKNAVIGREYVTGVKLEPGHREGGSAKALRLDMRNLDDEDRQPGEVTIKKAE